MSIAFSVYSKVSGHSLCHGNRPSSQELHQLCVSAVYLLMQYFSSHDWSRLAETMTYADKHKCFKGNLKGTLHPFSKTIVELSRSTTLGFLLISFPRKSHSKQALPCLPSRYPDRHFVCFHHWLIFWLIFLTLWSWFICQLLQIGQNFSYITK